jgi:hypothetical protein
MSETKQIYVAMAAVMASMSTVGKTGTNKEQHYKFRSIEDVMSAVRAGLVKHGVFYLPTVLSRIPEQRQTGGGKPMNVVHLEIRYDFYAADGSSVSSVVWGEGADMADKSTNKAMSQALKYNLVQAFSIAAEDMQDADRDTTEAGPSSSYGSAAEAFEGASPVAARQNLADEYSVKVTSFTTEDDGRELWRQVAAGAKDRDIAREDAKRLQDIIQGRIADIRAGKVDPVPGLDPEDDWHAKVLSIADSDDAIAAKADLDTTSIRKDDKARYDRIVAAIDAKAAGFRARAA